mmetsp:Transcript_4546/g.6940  ORF Transcript_4546/g.6940 Transcript_4546/m.6940 type:complete len:228 (-) Transcript_4546:523-1206(-)
MMAITAGMDMADIGWEIKCREEDLKQRALENERRAIDDARRSVDEKAEQLKALGQQSALIAGFAMVVMVEASIPEDLNEVLLVLYGASASMVVALMLISMLNATFILVAILRYDCVNREVPFAHFWHTRCETDFRLALILFSYGIPLFMFVLALLGWVIFWDHTNASVYASSVVSVIAVGAMTVFYTHIQRKWGDFLINPEVMLYNPDAGMAASKHKRKQPDSARSK